MTSPLVSSLLVGGSPTPLSHKCLPQNFLGTEATFPFTAGLPSPSGRHSGALSSLCIVLADPASFTPVSLCP